MSQIDLYTDYEKQIVHICFTDFKGIKIQLPRIEILKFIVSMTESLMLLDIPPEPYQINNISMTVFSETENKETIIPNEILGWNKI